MNNEICDTGAGKMLRERKTAEELEALIMQEARRRPDCSEVHGVVVVPSDGGEWRIAGTIRSGGQMKNTSVEKIAVLLRERYELAA